MGHIHAKLMAQYAVDAAETNKPWERWEFSDEPGRVGWIPCGEVVEWNQDRIYRRKPPAIMINGHEVPEPLREEPMQGQAVCIVDISKSYMVLETQWLGTHEDIRMFDRGFVHSDRRSAELHALALISFTEAK